MFCIFNARKSHHFKNKQKEEYSRYSRDKEYLPQFFFLRLICPIPIPLTHSTWLCGKKSKGRERENINGPTIYKDASGHPHYQTTLAQHEEIPNHFQVDDNASLASSDTSSRGSLSEVFPSLLESEVRRLYGERGSELLWEAETNAQDVTWVWIIKTGVVARMISCVILEEMRDKGHCLLWDQMLLFLFVHCPFWRDASTFSLC